MKTLLLIFSLTFTNYLIAGSEKSIPDLMKFPSSTSSTDAPDKNCDVNNEKSEFDVVSFDDISENISPKLKETRKISSFMKSCFEEMGQAAPNTFQDSIRFAVNTHLNFERGREYNVLSSYDTKNIKKKVSLISSPMCAEVDTYLISSSNTTKQKVSTLFKDKKNNFAKVFNTLRTEYFEAVEKKEGKASLDKKLERLEKFYYSFLATLAQHESLSTANSGASTTVASNAAKKYDVGNFSKPDDVKFYYDKYQSNEHSKYNMGLYQFSSNTGGNTKPCVESWNATFAKKYPKCKIKTPKHADLFKLLAAPDQIFNAFCGASKIVQNKMVQINTNEFERYKSKRRRTHIANTKVEPKTKKRILKDPKDRCFSPFSYTLHTYNHYGTLAHTVYLNDKGKRVSPSNVRFDNTGNITNVTDTNTTKVIDHMLGAIAPPQE